MSFLKSAIKHSKEWEKKAQEKLDVATASAKVHAFYYKSEEYKILKNIEIRVEMAERLKAAYNKMS